MPLAFSASRSSSLSAFVGDQRLGLGQARIKQLGAGVVAHLAFREHEHDGLALAVADGVQLGVQAASGHVRCAGEHPLFKQARRSPVRLEMSRIDHDALRLRAFACEVCEDAIEHAELRPAHEAVVRRVLCGP